MLARSSQLCRSKRDSPGPTSLSSRLTWTSNVHGDRWRLGTTANHYTALTIWKIQLLIFWNLGNGIRAINHRDSNVCENIIQPVHPTGGLFGHIWPIFTTILSSQSNMRTQIQSDQCATLSPTVPILEAIYHNHLHLIMHHAWLLNENRLNVWSWVIPEDFWLYFGYFGLLVLGTMDFLLLHGYCGPCGWFWLLGSIWLLVN